MLTEEEHACVEELAQLVRQRARESHLTKWFKTQRFFNAASQLWMLAVLAQRPLGLKITRNRMVLLLSDIFLEIAGVKSVSAKTIRDVKEGITRITDDGLKRDDLLLHLLDALAHPSPSRLDEMIRVVKVWAEELLVQERLENERREAEGRPRRFFGEEV